MSVALCPFFKLLQQFSNFGGPQNHLEDIQDYGTEDLHFY